MQTALGLNNILIKINTIRHTSLKLKKNYAGFVRIRSEDSHDIDSLMQERRNFLALTYQYTLGQYLSKYF